MLRNLCLLIVLTGTASASSANVTLFDGTFDDANWTTDTLLDTTPPNDASAVSGQTSADGDPSPSRQTDHNWQASSSGVSVRFRHLGQHLTYDPGTQGSIDVLDVSFDMRLPSAIPHVNTMGYGPLMVQDGVTYVAGVSSPIDSPTGWLHLDFSAATSDPNNWDPFGATGQPDFSATGSPITFGYVTTNGGSGTTRRLSATGRLDNYQVIITPEPASFALLGLGAAALIRRRSA